MSNRRGAGKEVSRTGLAEFFGVALNTVDHWVRAGCPAVKKGGPGRPWIFNTAKVAEWRELRVREEALGTTAASEAELKRRRLAAETQLAELKLAQEKRQVAPVDQMVRSLEAAFAEVRANMRNIPARAVRMLIGELDETRFKRVLLEEIDHALQSLADGDLLDEASIDLDLDDLDDAE